MDEEIEITSPDMWGEFDAACRKVFQDLYEELERSADKARRAPKEESAA
jgi:hypothetical protein